MMRWITFGVVVIVLSVGVTIGFPLLTGNGGKAEPLIPDTASEPSGPPPKMVVVGKSKHDFGVMTQHDHGAQDFTLKNEGQGDLVIWKGPSTCSCTIANLSDAESETGKLTLKPGEATTIKVTWDTKEFSNRFDRAVTIESNDPANPSAKFEISGLIYPAITLIPGEKVLNFMTPNNSKESKMPVVLFSHDRPDLKITEIRSTNPNVLAHSIRPVNDEEKKKFEIKSGTRVDIIVKEGADLGPFNEEVLIKTDHPKQPEIKLTALGRVEGPITMSPSWGIKMREVSSKKGGIQTRALWVRGKNDTVFTVVKKPAILDVAVEPTEASASDTAPGVGLPGQIKGRKYELTIRVKPGTPTGAVTDEIVIKTDHPNAPLLRVPVEVFVNSNS